MFLDVHELGSRLSYPPGTGVAIVGKVLRHVSRLGMEERGLPGTFMKDAFIISWTIKARMGLL